MSSLAVALCGEPEGDAADPQVKDAKAKAVQ